MFRKIFYTKLKQWEFWPWQIVYIPVIVYFLWLAIKSRSLFFFFSVNPGIEGGGLLAESKMSILKLIPDKFKPPTLFFTQIASLNEVTEAMLHSKIHFPVICKPDYGERGWMVEKINDIHELENYVKNIKIDFLVQEFVDRPIELGIFYVRMPDENKGRITSVVQKELLYVIGNGIDTIKNLVLNNKRAKIYLKEISKRHPDILNLVPVENERVELVPIGNHSRGTTFLNGNHLINEGLVKVIDDIASNINGFYYGRFDIRCSSVQDLYEGKGFKILELNGAKSEPAHIYHPGFPISEAYKSLFYHWSLLYQISRINHSMGYKYPSFGEGKAVWKKFRKIQKLRKS